MSSWHDSWLSTGTALHSTTKIISAVFYVDIWELGHIIQEKSHRQNTENIQTTQRWKLCTRYLGNNWKVDASF